MPPDAFKLLAAAMLVGAPALAGDYHTGATLRCGDCHMMHYSQSHGYNADGSGFFATPGGSGPYETLLRNEVNDLCLSCHDNNAASLAPDVLDTNTGVDPTDIRLAGYLNRLGAEGLDATGHTLDTLDTAPGSSPAWKPEDENGTGNGLRCTNCHEQHGEAGTGNNAYRNLRVDVGNLTGTAGLVTYATGTNDLLLDAFVRTTSDWDEGAMDWNEPDTTQSAIGTWCGGCHSNFHGAPGDGTTVGGQVDGPSYSLFLRHPTGGVNIGALGGSHSSLADYIAHGNKVKVMSSAGVWDPPGADVSPTCISCHKAHGNGNAFGLIYRSGTGTLTENGDTNGTQLEHLCGQCHGQASAFQNP